MQKKLFIHYACAGLTPSPDAPVTAISVYDPDEMTEHVFSLAREREALGNVPVKALEGSMLKKFFDFTAKYPEALWIHWHMVNHQYGFEVLEERYRLLCQEEASIQGEKIDLADMIYLTYRENCKTYPKLLPLLRANKLSTQKILSGEDEAKAFHKGKYKKIEVSSLHKVLAMTNLYHRLEENILINDCQFKKNIWMITVLSIVGLALWIFFGK